MGFLRTIVDETRESLSDPAYRAAAAGPVPALRASLRSAIHQRSRTGAILVEFKRISPGSTEPHLPARTPREFAAVTRAAPVAAYSCIATRPRFGGSLADVRELAAATDRPILFKDFVIDPVQVEAARRVGASAILLIARLDAETDLPSSLPELARLAHRRGLEVLLELHHRSELRRVADVEADVYGVNVRDLDTLRLEPDVAAATIRSAGEHRPLLGLSGVAGAEDARRFWALGVDGLLVGSAVARADDPARFLRSLERPGSDTT